MRGRRDDGDPEDGDPEDGRDGLDGGRASGSGRSEATRWRRLAERWSPAGLRDARLDVFHVVLDADEEALRQRIQGSAEARAWRLDHLAAYRSSRAWMIQAADLAVDTSRRTPAEIAAQIASALPDHVRTGLP